MNISTNFQYVITYKNIKNINIRAKDGILYISCNKKTLAKTIENLLNDNYSKLEKMVEKSLIKNEILSVYEKDNIYILGKKYQFIKIADNKDGYSIVEGKITLFYRNLDNSYTKMLKELANKYFNIYSKEISELMGLEYTPIELKKFSRCYGKNYNGEKIALNYLLIHMSEEYIKFIICHEYAHHIELNHSKNFYAILGKYFPNHRKLKKDLDSEYYNYL